MLTNLKIFKELYPFYFYNLFKFFIKLYLNFNINNYKATSDLSTHLLINPISKEMKYFLRILYIIGFSLYLSFDYSNFFILSP